MITLELSLSALVAAIVMLLISVAYGYSDFGSDWCFGMLMTVATIIIVVVAYMAVYGFMIWGGG
jgi:hypothetical protein